MGLERKWLANGRRPSHPLSFHVIERQEILQTVFFIQCFHLQTISQSHLHERDEKDGCMISTISKLGFQSMIIVTTQFFIHVLRNFKKNSKIAKNIKNPKKNMFFNIFALFLPFSASCQKNFKFSKNFGTRSTFNVPPLFIPVQNVSQHF